MLKGINISLTDDIHVFTCYILPLSKRDISQGIFIIWIIKINKKVESRPLKKEAANINGACFSCFNIKHKI